MGSYIRSIRRSARSGRSGSRPAPTVGDDRAPADPGELTVSALLELAHSSPAHVVRSLLEAERAGKARTSAISGLEQLLAR